MDTDPLYKRFPKVTIARRGAAFIIDYGVVALLSSLGGDPNSPGMEFGQVVVFLLLWLGMRVLLVGRNQGQSLGSWALDMKVVDLRFGRTPLLQDLFKREAMTGIGAVLTAIGLSHLTPGHGAGMLLLLPLAIDCSAAATDPMRKQAFHDRLANTMVVATMRGFSLDIKAKKWYRQLRRLYRERVERGKDRE
ncbi:RDD family protein [Phormidium sp. CCY1219]|uniref:RDD family protein n=1 Tax=Phormidium sp. CCY1219 TaxID=2886104 RepID=UPI002D1F59FB|nr:RDD family protein [Phormidium sp. CCY1219]MEB3827159.1 RDD family protein [Phormidium sp. CCY1219]